MRATTAPARLAAALLLVTLLIACLSVSATDVWLSGPSAMWGASSAATTAAVKQDFEDALGSGVVVSAAVAQVAPLSPAIGLVVTFTPPPPMTDAEALAALKTAPLTKLNQIGAPFSVSVHVLDVLPAAATSVTTGKTALSGASFFWEKALEQVTGKEAFFVLPLEVDVQASVDAAEQTYLVHMLTPAAATSVNASAMFVEYEWWKVGASGSLTADELTTQLNAAPLTSFNAYVDGLVTPGTELYQYRDLMPSNVHFTRALYPDPNADDTETVLPVVNTTTTAVRMYFSGDKDGWDTSSKALSDAVAADASVALTRGGFVNSAAVDSMSYVAGGDNSLGGLLVKATVTQGAQASALPAWSGDELASVLLLGTYSSVTAQYTGTGTAAIEGVSLDKKYGFKCTAGCVGMIIMAAIIVFFMIVAIVLACVCLCCCARFAETAPECTSSSSTSEIHEPIADEGVVKRRKSSSCPDEEL